MCYSYSSHINASLDVWVANIFSYSTKYLLILLTLLCCTEAFKFDLVTCLFVLSSLELLVG